MKSLNSFNILKTLKYEGKEYKYFSLQSLQHHTGFAVHKLPYCLKILLENVLRHEDGKINSYSTIKEFCSWLFEGKSLKGEIGFMPARVLMQDFTGVAAVVDLAAMRSAIKDLGHDPKVINPLIEVDLVVDHSIQVDHYGNIDSAAKNFNLEMERNRERYELLRWAAKNFDNFKVVPPGNGICHQINIEYLSKIVKRKAGFVYPDTLVGTDSHTTMAGGIGVLGWGVGGIEAESAMLAQPLPMLIPEVIGVYLEGELPDVANATDLVLSLTQMLRKLNVVGKLVEFYGPGLNNLTVADRTTISNMSPEYGATCGYFPVDDATLEYLRLTNKSDAEVELVKSYMKAQGMWHNPDDEAIYTQKVKFDLSSVTTSLAGPKRPQDRVVLSNMRSNFLENVTKDTEQKFPVKGGYSLSNGDVVIAAITSCTNTSNPYAMIGAGLIAKKIVEKGLKIKPWVKTSFGPGSKAVSQYLKHAGLDKYLDKIGFNLVGYGCTTCIGNSGPLLPEIEEVITANNLQVASVLSGNRNFEGRVHPLVKANYLASPILVVAYALAGSVDCDIHKDVLGTDQDGKSVYLKDIWPRRKEIQEHIKKSLRSEFFAQSYSKVLVGSDKWEAIKVNESKIYDWNSSTYINKPPYFEGISLKPKAFKEVKGAKILAIFGDSVTTDHISPAGNISKKSPAAKYLLENGVDYKDFNSYGARRGNHEVMMRGTFANIRIKNELCPGTEGGLAKSLDGSIKSIYEVSMEYQVRSIPLVIFAGKEYGTGSSRDWAAKGPALLGVRAIVAESFERIHRSNLVGMGILPLKFLNNKMRLDFNISGNEVIDIQLDTFKPFAKALCIIDNKIQIEVELQVFTDIEIEYLKSGSILHKVLLDQIRHKQ